MKSISTRSLSFLQAFRSEASASSASAASKVRIEWNVQANDWQSRLQDLEGWTGDLKQHHAEAAEAAEGPGATYVAKDAPDVLATLRREETAAMEETERLEFLLEVEAPVPVDTVQVAEDPEKAAMPSFYKNGEAVLYFSITNQRWLVARIQGDPAWMNPEEQIDREPWLLLKI